MNFKHTNKKNKFFNLFILSYRYINYVLKSIYEIIFLGKKKPSLPHISKKLITKNTISNLPAKVAVCLPAHNEGNNIRYTLEGLLNQKTEKIQISQIVVVSSASTDNTDSIVREMKQKDNRIQLIVEKERKGKASAINLFLSKVTEPLVIIQSSDTIPTRNTAEELCLPFINDASVGLTGGAPHPVNDKNTFIGYVVHMWWWFHRNIPRFGEIIAFRNIVGMISNTTAVDEAYIQAKIIQKGYKAVHVDTAVIHNKGPETLSDLIKQRRRIFNGHSRLLEEEGIKIDNMTMSSLQLLFSYKPESFKHSLWFFGGILIEIWARILGAYDCQISNKNPFIWDTATTTKNLAFVPVEEDSENDAINPDEADLAQEATP
ncbi:MAG: hypothetical protein QG639_29 [Patescibacteria group bacterium]|jgi:cellulose synthase/poly-beta-1,6-N-acetylglucosamine synthase-like glycosyltransferase|nr:hypothetical protein [Patescibacteria group bacterium]